MGHTTQAGVDLLGVGPSAISELRSSYAQSERNIQQWEEAVATRGLATLRGHRLTQDDRERRWVINRIMCHGELRADEFESAFGSSFQSRFASELEQLAPMVRDGLVDCSSDGSVRILPLGRLLVRNVAMEFDAYLADQRDSSKPMFSQTV
jgi:oxygen-independent coproporphyrinogen-3 oxidase